jgi:hypothetical protein
MGAGKSSASIPNASRLAGLPSKAPSARLGRARLGPARSALVRQKRLPGGNLKSLEGQLKKAKGAGKGAGKELAQAKKAAAPVQKNPVNEMAGLKKAAASKQHVGLKRTAPSRSALVRQKGLPGGNLKSVEGQVKKAQGAGKGGASKELGEAKKAAGLKKAPGLKKAAGLKKAPALKGTASLKKAPALKGAAPKALAPKRSALVRQKNVMGQQHLPDRGKVGKVTIGKNMGGSKKALSQSTAAQSAKKVGAVDKKILKPNKPRGIGGILRVRTPR